MRLPTTAWPTRKNNASLLRQLREPDLRVLNNLFLVRRIADADASGEMRQAIVHQRYKLRRSIVVTCNRVVQDWASNWATTRRGPAF